MVKRRKPQGNTRLSKDGVITNRGIDRLCSEIEEDDDANPDDIRAAVRRVYESLTDNLAGIAPAPPHPSELAFLCLAFGRYLDGGGKLSLDQSFGLVRSSTGHPGVPVREQKRIARAVWEQYLKRNDSLDAAAITVGAKCGKGKTQILKYFHAQFLPGYLSLVLPRFNCMENFPWIAPYHGQSDATSYSMLILMRGAAPRTPAVARRATFSPMQSRQKRQTLC
jgi:hypothetical protein